MDAALRAAERVAADRDALILAMTRAGDPCAELRLAVQERDEAALVKWIMANDDDVNDRYERWGGREGVREYWQDCIRNEAREAVIGLRLVPGRVYLDGNSDSRWPDGTIRARHDLLADPKAVEEVVAVGTNLFEVFLALAEWRATKYGQ